MEFQDDVVDGYEKDLGEAKVDAAKEIYGEWLRLNEDHIERNKSLKKDLAEVEKATTLNQVKLTHHKYKGRF
jgi:hypothetical protein